MDWQSRSFFSAFADDARLAFMMSCFAPPLVRLGYTTSDRSHSRPLGTRQIGQGNFERAPRVVVARVLKQQLESMKNQMVNGTITYTSS